MANTYSQLYIQIVFTVQGRQNIIPKHNREELHKYITGIVQNRGHKLLAFYCMPNHIHLLVGLRPYLSIYELVRDIKAGSSNFINTQNWTKDQFNWQEGYGAFSYSRSQVDNVIHYIKNQEDHHRKETFKGEYIRFYKNLKLNTQKNIYLNG